MLNKLKFLIFAILIIFAFSVCKFKLPTSPDTEESNNSIKTIWSPYVGVFPSGIRENIQQPHLLKLIQAGVLKGVRLGWLDNPDAQYFARWFQGHGVEVLGLFENKFLRDPNVCQIFSQQVRQNSGITTWEIGNEVGGFINMSPEEYIKISTKLFYYVKQKHPYIILAIGAVAGNGRSADALRRMIDAGLDKLCQDGLKIVPIHFYSWESTRLQEFKSQIARLSAHVRIWITETNSMPPSWNTQIGYVEEIYPKLKNSLRAERIYWYVFAENRDFHGGEFSLVKGLTDGPPIEYSPLMKLLIGDASISSTSTSTSTISQNDYLDRKEKKKKKIRKERR